MDRQNSDMIDNILPRYCEGTASEEECQLVEKWIGQSDENRRIAKQIHTIYLATDTMHVLTRVDTEKALSKVRQKMTTQHKKTWLEWTQRAAAILFIPLLATLLVQNFNNDSQLTQLIEVKANAGMTTTVNLPDGSVVHLNSESSLSYPSSFKGNIRKVTLKGEAFFTVSKDTKRQFVVSTPHNTEVEVLGTVFNVEAFEKDTILSTTLVEGKVSFSYTKNGQSKEVILKNGQKLVYEPKFGQARVYLTTGETETAWKDGKIIFSNTLLPQALHLLEKRYNVEFSIVNNQLQKESFTGSFTHQSLEHILEIFKISSNIKWRYLHVNKASDEKTKIEIY